MSVFGKNKRVGNKTLANEDVAQIIVDTEPTKRQKSESEVLINQIVQGKSIDANSRILSQKDRNI